MMRSNPVIMYLVMEGDGSDEDELTAELHE